MPEIVDVSITGPDVEFLAAHARELVEARLAACGNIIPTIRSIYRWQGAIEDDGEALLILHTRREHVAEIIRRTNASHPYDTVHVLATPVLEGDGRYLAWVLAETGSKPG